MATTEERKNPTTIAPPGVPTIAPLEDATIGFSASRIERNAGVATGNLQIFRENFGDKPWHNHVP